MHLKTRKFSDAEKISVLTRIVKAITGCRSVEFPDRAYNPYVTIVDIDPADIKLKYDESDSGISVDFEARVEDAPDWLKKHGVKHQARIDAELYFDTDIMELHDKLIERNVLKYRDGELVIVDDDIPRP